MNIGDIQALLNNTTTIYTKIEVLPKVDGESIITLTNEDSIKKWTYSDLRNVENQGFIGQFVARTLDGELQDISDDFNIEDRQIILYLGINREHEDSLITQNNVEITDQSGTPMITEIGTYSTTYYKLGNFFVEKPKNDNVKDSTKFQSTDYTILFNQTFDPEYTDSTYTKSFNKKIEDEETVTALWLTQYTCKQVGVELGTTNFANYDFVIDSNQFDSDYTCRDVIKAIAKLAFTWARIGWDNKLYLDFTKKNQSQVESYNEVTNDMYYGLTTQKDIYGEVNRVLTGSSILASNSAYVEDAQSIEDNGLTELDVYDNPILYTQELRESAITAGNRLLGLTYQPIEMETIGHPWLLGNELIKIVDMEGNDLYTYPLDRIIEFNGHIRTKINSVTKTKTETNLAYQGIENESKQVRRSRVELDRQNQLLTSTMELVDENTENISTIQQSVDGLEVSVETLDNTVRDVTNQVNTVLDSDNTVKGNPVKIENCGEFLIRNIAFYGNLEQNGTPTPDNPIAVEGVQEEHKLFLKSNNKFNINDDTYTLYGITYNIHDNVITISGTSTTSTTVFPFSSYFTLPAGTYTTSIYVESDGTSSGQASLQVNKIGHGGVTGFGTITNFIDTNYTQLTFRITQETNVGVNFTIYSGSVCNDIKIKIQVEEGSTVNPYGVFVPTQTFTYDFTTVPLYTIGNMYDKIFYNITDEKWYIQKTVLKKELSSYTFYFEKSNDNYSVFETGNINSDTTFDTINDETPCYSDYFKYKGDIHRDYDYALSQGVGIYKSYTYSEPGALQYKRFAIVIPNSIATTASQLRTWLTANSVSIYYTPLSENIQELENYDLIEQLNAILEQGKLYETNMIVEDVANDSGTTGDIEVNYLTNTTFNGIYASRAELNITQNSIESTVSETFTTSVQPVIESVNTLGEQLQNTEANLQSNIDDVSNSLGNYALNSSLITVTNTVQNIQTALNQQILVSKELQENGVTKVTTTTGFTFDENGLSVTKTGADTKTVVDEDGLTVYSATGSSDSVMLNADSQGVETENLHVRTYTQIGSHSRLQDYEDGTAIFYIA